jgi:hypothetical protein
MAAARKCVGWRGDGLLRAGYAYEIQPGSEWVVIDPERKARRKKQRRTGRPENYAASGSLQNQVAASYAERVRADGPDEVLGAADVLVGVEIDEVLRV